MNDKLFKWLPVLVSILLALFTLAASFGGRTAELSTLQNVYEQEHQTNISQEDKIQTLQIDNATDHQILTNIQNIVQEMKDDIKALKRGK